jgi:hypothetical protein
MIGYGIYPYSINNDDDFSDNGLITIPNIGHINIINDSSEYFII